MVTFFSLLAALFSLVILFSTMQIMLVAMQSCCLCIFFFYQCAGRYTMTRHWEKVSRQHSVNVYYTLRPCWGFWQRCYHCRESLKRSVTWSHNTEILCSSLCEPDTAYKNSVHRWAWVKKALSWQGLVFKVLSCIVTTRGGHAVHSHFFIIV